MLLRSLGTLSVKGGLRFAAKLAAGRRIWEGANAQDFLRNLLERQIGIVERVVIELANDFELRNREARLAGRAFRWHGRILTPPQSL